MIHEHFSVDIGYNDDKDCIEWSEITLSGRPIEECEQSDRELLQKGLEHYGINHISDETIMLILNCIGYEEKSWVEFVRKELEKRKKYENRNKI